MIVPVKKRQNLLEFVSAMRAFANLLRNFTQTLNNECTTLFWAIRKYNKEATLSQQSFPLPPLRLGIAQKVRYHLL